MTTLQKVRDDVLSLSASERACLAHDLILSLESPSDFELGEVKEKEIQHRVNMVREGKATGRPAAEVFTDIKAKY